MHLWKLPGAVQSPLRQQMEPLTGAALSIDGRILATSHRDHTVVIRDAATLAPRITIARQADPVTKLALNRGGDRLAAANMNGSVRVFELDRARLRALGLQEIGQARVSQLSQCREFVPSQVRTAGF
jgi:WD40 repeat protein